MTQYLLIGIIILAALLAFTGSAYLDKIEENGKLQSQIDQLNLDLNSCKSIKNNLQETQKENDLIQKNAFKKQDDLENTFIEINKSLSKQECKSTKSSGDKNEMVNSASIASELASVRVQLDKAACAANRNCPDSPK